MAPSPSPYRRLAKGSRYNSLWLASDHLLWVTGEGVLTLWNEKYARYYLRDIEAIFTVASDQWKIVNAVLGILAVPAWLMGVIYWSDGVAGWWWLGVGGLISLWLALRLWLGRGVVIMVQTAAGVTPTASVRRPRARRLLADLTPVIHAAQSDLPPLAPSSRSIPPVVRQGPPPVPPPDLG